MKKDLVYHHDLWGIGPFLPGSAIFLLKLFPKKYQTSDMIEQHHLLDTVAALVDAGEVRTTLTERLSPITAANLRKAHAQVEEGKMIGKIVLEKWDTSRH